MNEHDAFIKGIAANIYDDAPRLAFADWLDEHGDHDRAEFIRVQVELEPMRDQYEIPRADELHERESHLLYKHWEDWRAGLPNYQADGWAAECDFHRGFVDTVRLPARRFVERGGEIRAKFPTARRVVIFQLNGFGEQLAACPHLAGLAELELACWYSDDDIRALGASQHLSKLQVLELWLGRQDEAGTDGDLVRLAARAKAWPKLRELTLLDPEGRNEKSMKRLVTSANRILKRKIARHQRGYPELFPFAPGNRVGEPGRLPDGRLALAALDFKDPMSFEVITFKPDGTQTDEVIRVPLPAEMLKFPKNEWYLHTEKLRAHLTPAIGLTPCFIRIRGYSFPSHPYEGAYRNHSDDWDRLGYPDPAPDELPDGATVEDGNGEQIYWLVRNGEFTVANGDWWCDKRGHVHST